MFESAASCPHCSVRRNACILGTIKAPFTASTTSYSAASTLAPSAAADSGSASRRGMDRVAVLWIVFANLLAAGMMYQRLDKMGYLVPIKQQVAAVVEPVLETLGLFHASYQQCGLQDSTMFILTSSRVVHPDGVRPGASKHLPCRLGWTEQPASKLQSGCSCGRLMQLA